MSIPLELPACVIHSSTAEHGCVYDGAVQSRAHVVEADERVVRLHDANARSIPARRSVHERKEKARALRSANLGIKCSQSAGSHA